MNNRRIEGESRLSEPISAVIPRLAFTISLILHGDTLMALATACWLTSSSSDCSTPMLTADDEIVYGAGLVVEQAPAQSKRAKKCTNANNGLP
jgi:hypothetical protein